jgi:hypothetical protein
MKKSRYKDALRMTSFSASESFCRLSSLPALGSCAFPQTQCCLLVLFDEFREIKRLLWALTFTGRVLSGHVSLWRRPRC